MSPNSRPPGCAGSAAGTALTQFAYTAARRAAAELLGPGTLTEPVGALGYGDVDALFRG